MVSHSVANLGLPIVANPGGLGGTMVAEGHLTGVSKAGSTDDPLSHRSGPRVSNWESNPPSWEGPWVPMSSLGKTPGVLIFPIGIMGILGGLDPIIRGYSICKYILILIVRCSRDRPILNCGHTPLPPRRTQRHPWMRRRNLQS